MPPAVNASPETASPAVMPSEGVRTIVSLLLFLHLFALGLGIMTSDYGSSDLLRDIKEKTPGLESYLTQFRFDRSYDYHLMNDSQLDWDHRLEATVRYADGHTDKPIVLPEPGIWPSERRQRYQRLAWYVAMFALRAADEDAKEIDTQRKMELPKAIGGGLLRQHPDAESVSLRCIYHLAIIRELFLNSTDSHERDPNDSRYFLTDVDGMVVMDHGQPTYFENLPIAEVSPVRRAAPEKPKSSAPASAPPATSDSSKAERPTGGK
jgi:hypothetical protein